MGLVEGPFATALDSLRPPTPCAAPLMSDTFQQKATHASPSKRPRETLQPLQSPPHKRFKSDQNSATPKETIVNYDACPTPNVVDYFYQDLMPKASELSQLLPTLSHDAYIVRRWLGPAGCAIYWRMVMEATVDAPNPPHHLAGLIARSLAKLRGPQSSVSSPKFHTLCEILRLQTNNARKVIVFGESQ